MQTLAFSMCVGGLGGVTSFCAGLASVCVAVRERLGANGADRCAIRERTNGGDRPGHAVGWRGATGNPHICQTSEAPRGETEACTDRRAARDDVARAAVVL